MSAGIYVQDIPFIAPSHACTWMLNKNHISITRTSHLPHICIKALLTNHTCFQMNLFQMNLFLCTVCKNATVTKELCMSISELLTEKAMKSDSALCAISLSPSRIFNGTWIFTTISNNMYVPPGMCRSLIAATWWDTLKLIKRYDSLSVKIMLNWKVDGNK